MNIYTKQFIHATYSADLTIALCAKKNSQNIKLIESDINPTENLGSII